MKIFKVLFILLVVFAPFLFPSNTIAIEENQFVTIVNPVRISRYTSNPKETMEAQYKIVAGNNLPATWLLTFDALNDGGVVSTALSMNEMQELGIFLEVTPAFAEAAGVDYNDTGFWHHATSVFLSGYVQEDRIKLIETVFEKYKEWFGKYPTSVGSWWTDSYSLAFMKEKYDITANLGCSDQFSTDGYQIWGQYWSTPYYPSKYHSGIPATEESVKLDIVATQWAPRDPLNGYYSSLFSTQDYFVNPVNQDIGYFEKLVNLYAQKHRNEFGQITIGLESDLGPEAYETNFKQQIELVKNMQNKNEIMVANMEQFSEWYRDNFPKLSPPHIIETEDLLGKPIKIIWYQSPHYRLGISYNIETHETKIFDFRSYHDNFQEPYYQSPNKEFELSVHIPSYFDEVGNAEDVWAFDLGELNGVNKVKNIIILDFNGGGVIELSPEKISVLGEGFKIPKILLESSALKVKSGARKFEIVIKDNWFVGRKGVIFQDLTDIATHHLARKRTMAVVFGVVALMLILGFVVKYSRLRNMSKLILLTAILFVPIYFAGTWYHKNLISYYVSQGELDALYRLSVMPQGKVVVVDKECLGCTWHISQKPAAFANKRNYVKKYGKHPIVYNLSVFEAKDQSQAKEEFDKLKADYIYLVKYEDYIEKTPFSPGDLGIEKVYDNANAEIWKVKK